MAAQEAVQGLHNPTYVKNEAGGYDYGYSGNYSQLYNPYSHYGEQSYDQQHHYNPQMHDPNGYQQQYLPEQHYNMMPAHNNMYKEEQSADPYSFVEEASKNEANAPKKRGRKKKVKSEEDTESPGQPLDLFPGAIETGDGAKRKYTKSEQYKQRRKHDRFNGMTEEEVRSRTLPDHLAANLDVVIIGINPGLFAAYKGHHYAGPGNHFWKCLYLAGLVPEPMTADDDSKLIHFGIGFTNMVARATKGSADLTRKEIREGGRILLEKLQKFRPKIAVFNGKGIYEVFSGKKEFTFGKQPECIDGTNTFIWVMPSSSARCAQLPRAMDKVPFYAALKKFRDYLNGLVPEIDENEVIFNDPKIRAADDGTEISEHLKVDSVSSEDLGESLDSGQVPQQQQSDGPVKKKRGRPKKIKTDDPNNPQQQQQQQQQLAPSNSEDGPPKKKRGRPKKVRAEASSEPVAPPQQQQQQQQQHQPPAHLHNNQFFASHQQQWPSPHHSSASSTPLTPATASSPRQPAGEFDPAPGMSTATAMGAAQRVSPAQGSSGSEQQQQQQQHRATPGDAQDLAGVHHHVQQQQPQQHQQQQQQSPNVVAYHRPPGQQQQPNHNPYNNQDVATKSLSGLESLVDQIPNMASAGPQQQQQQQQHDPYHYPSNGYPQQQQQQQHHPNQHQQQQPPGNFSYGHYAPQYNGAAPYGGYHQGMQEGAPYPGYAMAQPPQQQQTNSNYAPYPGYAQYPWSGGVGGGGGNASDYSTPTPYQQAAPPAPPPPSSSSSSGYANDPQTYSPYPAYQ